MTGPAGPAWTGSWTTVTAANNGTRITDATFSCPYYNYGGGLYWLTIAQNADYWCKAPSYNTFSANISDYVSNEIGLTWQGSWPQTQTY
jgi:hypothetical protein